MYFYMRFQSELGAGFLCIEGLGWLAVQCISLQPATRNIASQRGQTDGALFYIKYFGINLQKRCAKINILGPKNVTIIYYRHKRQKVFPIKSNHH